MYNNICHTENTWREFLLKFFKIPAKLSPWWITQKSGAQSLLNIWNNNTFLFEQLHCKITGENVFFLYFKKNYNSKLKPSYKVWLSGIPGRHVWWSQISTGSRIILFVLGGYRFSSWTNPPRAEVPWRSSNFNSPNWISEE